MLSVVIPVFNGESTLSELVGRIEAAAESSGEEHEILFVDDGSTDESLSVIKQLADEHSSIGWISLKRNSGQQHAVLCGLRHSRGDLLITMDDDLEHPPEIIPLLVRRLKEVGADAVYAVADSNAVQTRRSGSVLRDLFFTVFLRKPAGLRIGSFRIFSRRAVEAVCLAEQDFVYVSAELFRRGFSAEELGYRAGRVTDSGRYSLTSRLRLYLKLATWYMPAVGRLTRMIARFKKTGPQYEIESSGGCL